MVDLEDEGGWGVPSVFGVVAKALSVGKQTLWASFGGVSVVSAAYFVRRSRWAQVRTMKYKLRKWKSQSTENDQLLRKKNKKRLQIKVDREQELEVLTHHFTDSKPTIAFLTGPEGSGKSWIAAQALRSVGNVLRVDLHKEQVSGGSIGATELLDHLVRKSGYYYPTNILVDLGFMQQSRDAKGQLNRKEVELALHYLETALTETVMETGECPCIFIDELHSLKESALKSNDFTRFLQWAMHVTDNGLCNVIFVGRDTSLYLLDQEHQSLRERRIHFPVDYPKVTPEAIKVALRHVNEGKIFDGAEEAKILCDAFGGQLRDIEKAIDAADNGSSIQATVSRMVTETAQYIQTSCLEPILADISKTQDKATLKECYKRYLRCWNMMGLFTSQEGTPLILQDRLLYEVFEESGHEIDEYVEKGILRYCWPPLGSNKTHEITLTPLSPRFQGAFRQLYNKPGLNKVAMDIKRELAKLELGEDQLRFSERVNILLSVQRVIGVEGPQAAELRSEMNEIWESLRQSWSDYDGLEK